MACSASLEKLMSVAIVLFITLLAGTESATAPDEFGKWAVMGVWMAFIWTVSAIGGFCL